MHRKFIALICAAALAVTAISLPAQARADQEDVAKVIAGLAVLAILGAALNDTDDGPVTGPVTGHAHPQKPHLQPRPLPRNVTRYDLPGQCLKTVRKGRQDHRILGRHCLEQNYRLTQSLPKACKVQIYGNKGLRKGYKPNCLRQHGYHLTVN